MKLVSPALQLVMSQSQFYVQELYTFTFADGTVLRVGDYDLKRPTLIANGFSYPATGLLFDRSKGKQSIGLQVGSLTIQIFADPLDTSTYINGITFQQFARNGGFDGASLQIDRCFMSEWGDCASNGTLLWFYGRVADSITTRSSCNLTIKALTDLLANTMPRDVYQPGCRNVLYDPNTCGLNKVNFSSGGIVLAGTITQTIIPAILGAPDGAFTLGTIHFDSGANTGQVRTVKAHSAGGAAASTVSVTLPWIVMPSPGDTFTIYEGCDMLMTTCQNKFNNFPNFRAEPFIPAPETATP